MKTDVKLLALLLLTDPETGAELVISSLPANGGGGAYRFDVVNPHSGARWTHWIKTEEAEGALPREARMLEGLDVQEVETGEEEGSGQPAQPNKFMLLLKSRKFWALVVGLVLTIARAADPNFPITEEQATNLVYVLVAYILGSALEDGLTAVNRVANG